MPDAVSILVLRHGQSEWNAVKRWQGTADSPLTEVGRDQAAATARVLSTMHVEFAAVTASDLARAAETAGIIAARLGATAPRLDSRLREAHAGEWEGMTPAEIEQQYPGWLAEHRRPAGFEPFDAVIERVTAALGDVARAAVASDSGTTLVVAHSGVIRSLIRHLGGIDGRIPNLGGIWLDTSVTGDRVELALGPVFDPHEVVDGIVVSGIDAPGEDPGE